MEGFDLGYVVAFLEGEGYFGCHVPPKGKRGGGMCIRVTVAQTQREPLERLRLYTGVGNITGPRITKAHPQWAPTFWWLVTGEAAAGLMRLVRPFMSPKRVFQIDAALVTYGSRRTRAQYLSTPKTRDAKGRFLVLSGGAA